jgi:hypothetical protein
MKKEDRMWAGLAFEWWDSGRSFTLTRNKTGKSVVVENLL